MCFTGLEIRHGASKSKATWHATKRLRDNDIRPTVSLTVSGLRRQPGKFASSLAVDHCQPTMARANAQNIVIRAAGHNLVPECQCFCLNTSLVPFSPISLSANVYAYFVLPPCGLASRHNSNKTPAQRSRIIPTSKEKKKISKPVSHTTSAVRFAAHFGSVVSVYVWSPKTIGSSRCCHIAYHGAYI